MIGRPSQPGLLWSFSTLGCSELTFPEICELAGVFDFPGLELRGMGGRLDLPRYCAETGWSPARMQGECRRHRTQLVVAGSSFKLLQAQPEERVELDDLCAWADSLAIPYVRVFGGGKWGTSLTEREYRCAAEAVRWWRELKRSRGWRVELLLETHSAFSATTPCLELFEHLSEPLPLLWDSHHTWHCGGESPAHTWAQLGSWIRHVHVKDSVATPSPEQPFTYVLPGKGQMPLGEVLALLQRSRFAGFVSLEWERLWHPELPPLREALVQLRDFLTAFNLGASSKVL